MSTFVPLLAREQVERLPERACEVVEYRKSRLTQVIQRFDGVDSAWSRQAAHHIASHVRYQLMTFFASAKESA